MGSNQMQNPEIELGRENDHDYLGRRPIPQEDDDSQVFEQPLRRRRGRSANVRLQLSENTDHDYLGTEREAYVNNDAASEEAEDEPPDRPEQEEDLAAVEQRHEEIDVVTLEDESNEPNENTPPDPGPDIGAEAAGTSAAAATVDVINLSTPSPAKKRKRLSLGVSKSNTPKVKSSSASGGEADDDEDDGLTCPICLDTWEMSGEHRLVSLRCGHLFGDACIRRWLNESARQSGIKACPQCKTKATNKDIRCLYAKRLRAIDRSEEHRLREQLDDERRRTQTMQTELATMKMSYSLLTKKIHTLEAENERMILIMRNNGGGGFSYTSDFGADPKQLMRLQSYKLFMERNIEIAREPGCRVMLYAQKHTSMIVSQKSAQSLFPGYGLRFIDTPTFRSSNFLHTSAKLLRDICLSSDQQMLAVASMETRTKLFDLRTRQVVSVFTPGDKNLWACAMDRNERENFLYLGAQHGSTYVYDVRFPETVVDEFKTEGDLSPVINIAPVSAGKLFPSGGFLVCKLQSLWFYEYSSASGTATPTRLNVEGPFISMSFDAAHETLLVSARCSTRYPQSRYILGQLDKLEETTVFNVKISFFGSKSTPVMTRCSQIAVEANTLVAGYIQDAKLLALFDARREQRLQSMPVQELIYDTCPVYTPNATYLAALTETKCRIYKLAAMS